MEMERVVRILFTHCTSIQSRPQGMNWQLIVGALGLFAIIHDSTACVLLIYAPYRTRSIGR